MSFIIYLLGIVMLYPHLKGSEKRTKAINAVVCAGWPVVALGVTILTAWELAKEVDYNSLNLKGYQDE